MVSASDPPNPEGPASYLGRAMGIDLGSKRIGVALASGGVATPLTVVQRGSDTPRAHRELRSLVAEWEVDQVVVGLPLHLSGAKGQAAQAAEAEVLQLRVSLGVPVTTYDERLTTVSADRSLRAINMDGHQRRAVIDQVAAAVMLQAWVDGQSARSTLQAGPPAGGGSDTNER